MKVNILPLIHFKESTMNYKKHLVLIFILFFINLLYSQNGYKNFKWGESIISVQSKSKKLLLQNYSLDDYKGLFIPFYNDYRDLFDWLNPIPNPITKISGIVKVYEEEGTERLFFFRDSSLFAVELRLTNIYALKDLENKYGSVIRTEWHDGYWNYDMRAWIDEPDRIISYRAYSYFDTVEYVTYIDKSLYLYISDQLITARRQQLKTIKDIRKENYDKGKKLID